jgi:transposase-like protein
MGNMDFPITDLMDRAACLEWLEAYFHPKGLKCPHCQADFAQAHWFRDTKRSQLDVYRCQVCKGIYNLYSGTIFEGRYFRPEQTVLFIRGVCQGKSSSQLARELNLSRTTVIEVRHKLQANAEREQPEEPLDDQEVETDEMFQNAGEKRGLAQRSRRPTPPPRQQTAWARHV